MPVVPLQPEMSGARPGERDLERPEVEAVDRRRSLDLEGDAGFDEMAGACRQRPSQMERRRAVPRRREAAGTGASPQRHRRSLRAKPDARVTAPRIHAQAAALPTPE